MTQPPPLHDEATTAALREARITKERYEHDRKVAINIAAELQRAYQAELARRATPKPERQPGEGEVPAERFGPRDRTR